MYLNIKKFTDKMDAGEPCLGSAVTYGDLSITEALATECDFIWIDLEHSPTNMESLVGHMIACRATGTPFLVRIPPGKLDGSNVSSTVVPGGYTSTSQELREIKQFVEACYYPLQEHVIWASTTYRLWPSWR